MKYAILMVSAAVAVLAVDCFILAPWFFNGAGSISKCFMICLAMLAQAVLLAYLGGSKHL